MAPQGWAPLPGSLRPPSAPPPSDRRELSFASRPLQEGEEARRSSGEAATGSGQSGASQQPRAASAGSAPAGAATWVDTLPRRVQPYAKLMRLEAPIGSWLLFWPGAWSIALAAEAGQMPDMQLLALFGAGSVLLRGAGCTINDFWDRDIDKQVERTKNRPIASGAISPPAAIVFLSAQLLAGLGILVQLNDFSKVVGAASLGLVFTYPLMKRLTFWPQAFLGLTFNWGAILGWAAVHGNIDLSVVGPLYASGVAWTLVYDTIYAHQDKADDAQVGVYSTALRFGEQTPVWLTGFGGCMISGLMLSGYSAGLGWPFYASTAAAAAHVLHQVHAVDLNDKADCAAKFRSNAGLGALVFSGIVAGNLMA